MILIVRMPITLALVLFTCSPAFTAQADGKAVFEKVCSTCHATGIAGAPVVGNRDVWEDRIAQGKETLYGHALNGFQGSHGFMPARGGNPELSDEEVRAAVDYMVEQGR